MRGKRHIQGQAIWNLDTLDTSLNIDEGFYLQTQPPPSLENHSQGPGFWALLDVVLQGGILQKSFEDCMTT